MACGICLGWAGVRQAQPRLARVRKRPVAGLNSVLAVANPSMNSGQAPIKLVAVSTPDGFCQGHATEITLCESLP